MPPQTTTYASLFQPTFGRLLASNARLHESVAVTHDALAVVTNQLCFASPGKTMEALVIPMTITALPAFILTSGLCPFWGWDVLL